MGFLSGLLTQVFDFVSSIIPAPFGDLISQVLGQIVALLEGIGL